MKTMPNPLMPTAVDLLMMVGKEFYTVPQYIRETTQWGVSKRIPPKSIPEGIVPGVSRLFIWHPEAIPLVTAEGKTLADMAKCMVELDLISQKEADNLDLTEAWNPGKWLLPDDYVPPYILTVTCGVQDAEPEVRRRLEKEFAIRWQGGVILYTLLGEVEYVVRKGETELPEEIERLGDLVKPVVVEYVKDDGEAYTEEELLDTPEEEE